MLTELAIVLALLVIAVCCIMKMKRICGFSIIMFKWFKIKIDGGCGCKSMD